jgi:hypothetical protein
MEIRARYAPFGASRRKKVAVGYYADVKAGSGEGSGGNAG